MMPTGRRRQFTSSVKQLFQLSTMRILSWYESPNARRQFSALVVAFTEARRSIKEIVLNEIISNENIL